MLELITVINSRHRRAYAEAAVPHWGLPLAALCCAGGQDRTAGTRRCKQWPSAAGLLSFLLQQRSQAEGVSISWWSSLAVAAGTAPLALRY